ncbi:unnamed protein product [Mytilus edulis]|uniref:Ankyrin repeat protein n=1 Tax=Mytilus edulis TaxID=6550 RepID=A0A8S3UCL1_MYTED|nr:unnamed protein product [Mytilus edulis]
MIRYVNKESLGATPLYITDGSLQANYHRTLDPLNAACYYGLLQVVELLVQSGIDVNLDNYHEFPVYVATYNGYYEISGSDINLCDVYGKSPLLASIETGHFDIVKLLVDYGCKINSQLTGNSLPLTSALMQGNVEIATYLIQTGADYNMQNEYGVTSIQLALWKNHTEILHHIIALENKNKPQSGNLKLYQLLVNMHKFEIYPETVPCTNECVKAEGLNYNEHRLALLSFISRGSNGDDLKHLLKLD